MNKKTVSGILLTLLLLIAIPGSAFNTQRVGASGTIYMRVALAHDIAVLDAGAARLRVPDPVFGMTIPVFVVGENQGDWIETFAVLAFCDTTLVGTSKVSYLEPGWNWAESISGDLESLPNGVYTLSANASVPGDTDIADNYFANGEVLKTIFADVTGDGLIDLFDLFALGKAYNATTHFADFNSDGIVNMTDAHIMDAAYGSTVGSYNWNPYADLDGDGYIGSVDAMMLNGYIGITGDPLWNLHADTNADNAIDLSDLLDLSKNYGVKTTWFLKPPPTEWTRTYRGTSDDEAFSLVQTGDGGYALAGFTASFGAGYEDFWLVKTDAAGNVEWNRTYGGTHDDYAFSVVQTGDGGYALAGYTGYDDFWLVKTDAAGNMQWNQTYGGAGLDLANAVVQTSDGGYALAGGGFANLVRTDASGNMLWSKAYGGTCNSLVETSDGGYALGGTTSFGAGLSDFWLVKTDAAGNVQWNRTYGGTEWDLANAVVQTSDGGYALAGVTHSFGAGSNDFWLVKTDAAGNMQWNQTYGGPRWENAYSMVQTNDGGYAIAGSTGAYGAGECDVWLVKVEPYLPPVLEFPFGLELMELEPMGLELIMPLALVIPIIMHTGIDEDLRILDEGDKRFRKLEKRLKRSDSE